MELAKENGTTVFIKSQYPTGLKRSIYVSTKISVLLHHSEMGLEPRVFVNETTCFDRSGQTELKRTFPFDFSLKFPEILA